jgi:hypothetical protein
MEFTSQVSAGAPEAEPIPLFTQSDLARLKRRTRQAISPIAKRVRPFAVTARGRRPLYTAQQIDEICRAYRRPGRPRREIVAKSR